MKNNDENKNKEDKWITIFTDNKIIKFKDISKIYIRDDDIYGVGGYRERQIVAETYKNERGYWDEYVLFESYNEKTIKEKMKYIQKSIANGVKAIWIDDEDEDEIRSTEKFNNIDELIDNLKKP